MATDHKVFFSLFVCVCGPRGGGLGIVNEPHEDKMGCVVYIVYFVRGRKVWHLRQTMPIWVGGGRWGGAGRLIQYPVGNADCCYRRRMNG